MRHDAEYTIHGLKLSARRAAAWRGHTLGPWQQNEYYGNRYMHAACPCGAAVTVTTRPMPNETWICGDAVAVSCGDSQRSDNARMNACGGAQ